MDRDKQKINFSKIILLVILYSIFTHWKDVKQGFSDGLNDGYKTAIAVKAGK